MCVCDIQVCFYLQSKNYTEYNNNKYIFKMLGP